MEKEKIMHTFREYLLPGLAYGTAVNIIWILLAIVININAPGQFAQSLGLLFLIYLGLLTGIGFISSSKGFGRNKIIAVSFMIPFITIGGFSVLFLAVMLLTGVNPVFVICTAPFLILGAMISAAFFTVPNYLIIILSKKAFLKGGNE